MTSSFAEAQQRLAARRQAREAAASANLSAQQASSQARARLARLPFPFNRLTSAWDSLVSNNNNDGTRPSFRVGQVDAELLDEELVDLFKGQVGDALKYLGGHLADDWAAEIQLALRAVLFKLTMWDHDATYGASLQNLRYTDARRDGPVLVPPSRGQKTLYGLVTVGGRYAWTKWEDWLRAHDDDDNGYGTPSRSVQRLSRLTEALSTTHAAAAVASFLVFLLNGRYRTLLDRVLRLRLAPPTSQLGREVSFEYLNRQLVWHAFTEFLLFVLPLVGVHRWRRWLSRTWRKTKSILRASRNGSGGGEEGDDDNAPRGELGFLPERTCAICYEDQNSAATAESEMLAAAAASSGVVGSAATDVTNPYETVPCGCVYCFVCLATRIEREEGEGWTCLRCGELVKECRPWRGDVLEPAATSTTSHKTVAFSDEVGRDAVFVDVRQGPSSNSSSSSSGDPDKTYDSSDEEETYEEAEED